MRGLPYDRTQLFLCAFLKLSRLIPQWNSTLQTGAPTHDVHGAQGVLFVRVQEKQVKSDNIVEHEGAG